jgi:hypothetical protein
MPIFPDDVGRFRSRLYIDTVIFVHKNQGMETLAISHASLIRASRANGSRSLPSSNITIGFLCDNFLELDHSVDSFFTLESHKHIARSN